MRVIGIGNILLCDEGVGVHAAVELARRGGFPGVEFLDGGVAGAGLLNLIEEQEKVVIVDAVTAPFPPGTVLRLSPDDLGGSRASWSLHDVTLADVLGLMRLRGTTPPMRIVGVVPADIETYRIGLSGTLADKFEEILGKVAREISDFLRAAPGTAGPAE